jgi:hypothetical protein
VGDSIERHHAIRLAGQASGGLSKATIRGTVYVRGGGGCQHYREEGRVAKNIVPRRPDLVLSAASAEGY